MPEMITQTTTELLLFTACAIVWLGPALSSALRRQASLLHPSFMVPAYLMFSVSVALSEHWFHWSGRGSAPGLRAETQALQEVGTLYILPLAIVLALGFVFHFAVWLGCGRVRPRAVDRIHLTLPRRLQAAGSGAMLAGTCLAGILCCCLPYLVFGQGRGFFWTVAVYNCIPFLVFLVTLYARRYGALLVLAGLATMLLYPSKQNFVYYLFPYILFWQGTLISGTLRVKLRAVLATVVCASALYYGTNYLIDLRHERDPTRSLVEYALVREYGFESFAVLTNAVPLSGAPDSRVALARNLFDLVPSAILPFELQKTRGEGVFGKVMVRDVKINPNAGFYRFLCFDAYYDYGILGALAYCFLFGYLLATFYRYALRSAQRHGTAWPLVCYLPWPMYAQFWVNGCIAFGISFSCSASAAIYLIGRTLVGHPQAQSRSNGRRLMWQHPRSGRPIAIGAKFANEATGERQQG
jgi:hypothetical protein